MSPRRSAVMAAETRTLILREAVDQASRDGLEATTVGSLARRLGMSKAGVVGPFGSKGELQLAALRMAIDVFRGEIWEPCQALEPGLERLEAFCAAWLSYLERDVFPGGCFLTQAACDFDGRPGPIRDEVERALALWDSVLEREAARAIESGQIAGDLDPAQIAFELGAIAQGTNQARQLRGDPEAIERGRRAMRRALGGDKRGV